MCQTLQRPVKVKASKSPPRITELAVLPVFFPLKDRPVVVAGGTAAAAWKAELLAATGAEVHVYADQLEEEFHSLIQRADQSGRIVVHNMPWATDAFEGKALAIADTANESEAEAFYNAAKHIGVPVNVIDNPRFCEFQFGSIINRSPVVIGVSTNGFAPILGQAIRRKIEALLPANLPDWAAFAGSIRVRVQAELEPGPERRRFWERFVDLVFAGPAFEVSKGRCLSLLKDAKTLSTSKSGSVTLVGVGPGNAELLTLRAVRALQGADVILFDDPVDGSVLELGRREAKRIFVEKRRRKNCRHENKTIGMAVRLVSQGQSVVRLIPGDPMNSGRAGEELAMLAAEGVPATVVPGISEGSKKEVPPEAPKPCGITFGQAC